MVINSFTINFRFPYPSKDGYIEIAADVEKNSSENYYVSNFRLNPLISIDDILPPISIKKISEIWVHTDTNKETQLSLLVGTAIDKVSAASNFKQ
jgi:hypothetical protein